MARSKRRGRATEKVAANASKHRSVTYERAGQLIDQLKLKIADLLGRAEAAGQKPHRPWVVGGFGLDEHGVGSGCWDRIAHFVGRSVADGRPSRQ